MNLKFWVSNKIRMSTSFELFSVLLSLEGSVQLYKSGMQVQEYATRKYRDFYLRKSMFHKEMIEVYSKILNWESTPDEIADNEFPIVRKLLNFPPYLEYLKKSHEVQRSFEEKEDLPFYI